MAEIKTEKTGAFKIWKNPETRDEGPRFMGDFYPPDGQDCFYQVDLVTLGFPAGHYTVRVPEDFLQRYPLPKWQRIRILP